MIILLQDVKFVEFTSNFLPWEKQLHANRKKHQVETKNITIFFKVPLRSRNSSENESSLLITGTVLNLFTNSFVISSEKI